MNKAVLALFIGVFGFSALAEDNYIYIDGTNVNVRSQPNRWNSAVNFQVNRKSGKLKVLRRVHGWAQVQSSQGIGWIYENKPYVKKAEPTSFARVAKPIERVAQPAAVVPTPVKAEPVKEKTAAPAATATAPAKASASVTPEKAAPAVAPVAATPAPAAPMKVASVNPTATQPNSSSPSNVLTTPGKNRSSISNSKVNSACIGDPKDPIGVVYVHGWFPPDGSNATYIKYETDNRKEWEEYARKKHVRIAAPLAPRTGGNGMAEWNGANIQQLEAAAKDACGGGKLAEPRDLAGFSSGAFEVNNLVCRSNRSVRDYILSNYSKILTMGMQKSASCNDVTNVAYHRKSGDKSYILPTLTKAGWISPNTNYAQAEDRRATAQ